MNMVLVDWVERIASEIYAVQTGVFLVFTALPEEIPKQNTLNL